MVELAIPALRGRQPHPLHRAAERAGGHRPEPAHGAPHSHQGRHWQSTQPASVPRQPYLPIWRQSVLPVHLLGTAPLLDGNHHAWLEDRGPKFALLLAVDDATGAVANAVFRTGEDTRGYFILREGLIQRWGIPLALYSDRHAVFKHNARKPESATEATQLTRGVRELGIRQIFGRSPQAKGRMERHALHSTPSGLASPLSGVSRRCGRRIPRSPLP